MSIIIILMVHLLKNNDKLRMLQNIIFLKQLEIKLLNNVLWLINLIGGKFERNVFN